MRTNGKKQKKSTSYIIQFLIQSYHSHNKISRPKLLCMALLFLKMIQRLSLLLNASILNKIKTNDVFTEDASKTTFDIISYFDQYYNKESTELYNFIYAYLAINGIFLLQLIIINIIQVIQTKRQLLLHYYNLVETLNSIILKIYNYIIFIPSLYMGFWLLIQGQSSYYIQSWCNIILTIVIGILSSVLDFSQDFQTRDYLNKRASNSNVFILVIDGIFCLISQFDINEVTVLWSIFLSLARLMLYYFEQDFFNQGMNRASLTYILIQLNTSLLTLLYFQLTYQTEWLLLIIIQIPLTIKLSDFLFNIHLRYNIQKSFQNIYNFSMLSDLSLIQFETLIHAIHQDTHFYEDYVVSNNGKGVLIESLAASHYQACKDNICFCKEFSKSTTIVKFKILYITFLLEVYQYPTKCFTEILECVRFYDQYGWKEKCLLQQLKTRIEINTQNKLIKYENQKLSTLISIQFDELVSEIEEQLLIALPQYRNYLNYISQNFIDIENLQKIGLEYIEQRNIIDQKIHQCYILNSENKYLAQLTYLYIDFLDFRQRRQKDFKRFSYIQRTRANFQFDSNAFSESTIVLFISLLKPVGKMLKFSHNFPYLLGYNMDELSQKQLNILLPQDISKIHDQILVDFIDQFLVPIDMRFKLDYLGEDNELGVSGLINMVMENVEYITFHQSGKISETTERFYSSVLEEKGNIPFEKVCMIDIHKLIPYVGIMRLQNELQQNGILKTYFFLPKKDIGYKIGFFQKNSISIMKKSLYDLIQDYDSFNYTIIEAQVELRVVYIQSVKQNFNYVCISNMKQIRIQQEKVNIIDEIQRQSACLQINSRPSHKTQKKSIFVTASSVSSKLSRASRFSTRFFINQNAYDERKVLDISDNNAPETSVYDSDDYIDIENEEEGQKLTDDQQLERTKIQQNNTKRNSNPNESQEQNIIQLNQTAFDQNDDYKQQTPIMQSPDKINEKQNFSYLLSTIQNERGGKLDLQNLSQLTGLVDKRMQDESHNTNNLSNLIDLYQLSQTERLINLNDKQLQIQELYSKQDSSKRGGVNDSRLFDALGEATERNLINGLIYTKNDLETTERNIMNKQDGQAIDESSSRRLGDQTGNRISELQTDIQNSQLQRNGLQNSDNLYVKQSSKDNKANNLKKKQKVKKRERKQKHERFGDQVRSIYESKKSEQKQQNIASSVNSTRTANFQRKHEIIKQITIQKQNRFLNIIKYTGVVSLATLITVSAILFSNTLTLFDQELSAFKDIPYAVSIRADYSLLIQNKELEVLLDKNVFNFSKSQEQQVASMYQSIKDDNLDKFNHYKMRTIQYYYDTKSNGLKDYMLNKTLVLKNYSQMKGYKNQTFSLPYAFLYIQENLFYYMNNGVNDLPSYNNIQQNFIAMFAEYSNIQNIVVTQAYALCEQITSLLYVSLIVIITISFFFIFIIFPIYSSIQQQREEILKLNSTFDPSKFEPLINALDILIEKGNIMSQGSARRKNLIMSNTLNSTQKIQQQQKSSKKKMLSSTTSLRKMNPLLIFIGLLVFFLLTIYPLVNLLVISDFINEGKYNISEIASLYSARAQLTSNYAANYMAMSGSLTSAPLDSTKYKRVHSLASTNQSKLQEILNIFDNFTKQRYNDSVYKGFFIKILKENICDAFKNYPEYITTSNYIDDSECREISNHLLEKGLYFALKYVFTKYEEVLPYYDKKSPEEFIQNMRVWVNEFDFFEFNKLYRLLIKVIESLRIFMETITSEYFSFVIKVSSALFFYSLSCLLLVFYFCWIKFFQSLSDSIVQTRKVLTAVGIGYIIDNPYIMSFLNKENKK